MIDKTSGKTKHIITEHNNYLDLGNGRFALVAYTYCGWVATEDLEKAYAYGEWYLRTPNVCPFCLHVAQCEIFDPDKCDECKKAMPGPRPYPDDESGGLDNDHPD